MGRPESDDERQPQEPITKKRRRDEHLAPLTLNVALDPEPKEVQADGGSTARIPWGWESPGRRTDITWFNHDIRYYRRIPYTIRIGVAGLPGHCQKENSI